MIGDEIVAQFREDAELASEVMSEVARGRLGPWSGERDGALYGAIFDHIHQLRHRNLSAHRALRDKFKKGD